eukprot:EG_transcript_4030
MRPGRVLAAAAALLALLAAGGLHAPLKHDGPVRLWHFGHEPPAAPTRRFGAGAVTGLSTGRAPPSSRPSRHGPTGATPVSKAEVFPAIALPHGGQWRLPLPASLAGAAGAIAAVAVVWGRCAGARAAPRRSFVVLNMTAEQRPTSIAVTDYDSLKVTELRGMLKALGLRQSGLKAELVRRLRAWRTGATSPEDLVAHRQSKRKVKAPTAVQVEVVRETGLPNMNAAAQRDLGQAVALFEALQAEGKVVTPKVGQNLLFYLAGGTQWEELLKANVTRPGPCQPLDDPGPGAPVPGSASAGRCAEHVYGCLREIEAPTDTSITLMARVYATMGDLPRAEAFLSAHAAAATARSYHPLLMGLAARGDAAGALRVFDVMVQRRALISPVEVALLLDATAAGAVGSQWVDSVLQRASAVLDGPVTPAVLQRLQQFYATQADHEAQVVTVDENGRFSVGDREYTLQQRPLDPADVRQALEQVQAVVDKSLFGSALRNWLRWRPHYDVVIDGSSIGSCGQESNPNRGQYILLACGQIQAVMDAARRQLGCRAPLVLLPRKFTVRLPPAEEAWVQGLARMRQLYKTPVVTKLDWSVTYASLLADIPYITRDNRQTDLRQQLPRPECFDRWRQARRIGVKLQGSNGALLLPPPPYSVVLQRFERGWMVPLSDRQWLQIVRR